MTWNGADVRQTGQAAQAGRQGVIVCHFCYFSQAATNILRPSIHISIIIVKLGLEKAKSGNCSADAFFWYDY